MHLQNRVDPWGRLQAVAARGAWMGNRGILHNAERRIVRPWAGKAWITCVREFKGIQRQVFGRGTYSELFFLDEATAFAAGHRPCATCRKPRFVEFKAAWLAANPNRVPGADPPIAEIDRVLHAERALPGGGEATFRAPLDHLPSGTFIEWEGEAHLIWEGATYAWSFAGYERVAVPVGPRPVVVLTPASIVRLFGGGFRPQVHPSAGREPVASTASTLGSSRPYAETGG